MPIKYKTIVVDPPWKYKDRLPPKHGRAPYKFMELGKIKALPVNKLAAQNCHLYLWTTNAFIKEALEVLEAWDFRYKTMITWIKPCGLGLGYYWRNNTEHCLFAIKGKMKVRRNDIWNIIIAPRRRHSEKPIEFFACVEEMSPRPRIGIFARNKRSGWDSWGNEVKSDIRLPHNNK